MNYNQKNNRKSISGDCMLRELKNIRKAHGVSQVEAADRFGVPLSTYRNWEQCKNMPRDSSAIKEMAEYFCVSLEALLGYDIAESRSSLVDQDIFMFGYVPLVDEMLAGEPVQSQRVDESMPVPSEVLSRHPHAFLLRVTGNSVNRKIPKGYYALVDPDEREISERGLYAICVSGVGVTIRHVKKLDNGYELAPESYDPTCLSIVLDYNDPTDAKKGVTVVGRVVYAMMPFDYEV